MLSILPRLFLAGSLLVALTAAAADGQPVIDAPASLLIDSDWRLAVRGLEPHATYVLQGEFVSRAGTVWRSDAMFPADANGVIDPAAVAPDEGTYGGVDPIGLVWSMTKTTDRQADASLFESDDGSVVTVSVRRDAGVLAERRIRLVKRQSGVSATDLREPFAGAFYAPYGGRKLPAVIVLGGSEGGIPREQAALLASHGYAALALAYFGLPPLPNELDRVPVETVGKALQWLAAQPAVDGSRIAIVGFSKGAELALIAAGKYAAIRATVAVAPASASFQSLRADRMATPSWTWQEKEVPFAPFVASEAFTRSHRLSDLYISALEAAPPDSAIAVEALHGPLLLIAGKRDALWPSALMAGQLLARAERTHARVAVTNKQFDDAGHHAGHIPLRPTADSVRLGGSAAGNAHAQLESWREIVRFLSAALRK
jgi:dienelactone hydrolase